MKIDNNLPLYSISVVARLTGITSRMIREYENRDLIKPQRIKGRRLFSQNEIGFIEDIKFYLKEKKVSLSGLKELYRQSSCREIKRCQMRQCPAYSRFDKPCWILVKNNSKCWSALCPNCPVYLVRKTQSKGRTTKEPLSPLVYSKK